MRNKSALDQKVKSYVNQLFSGVGKSQQLFELKEELTTNLKEKINDYKKMGMDEKEAFKKAVSSMGNLSELVNDMRVLGQDNAKQAVYTTMTARVSSAGLVIGILVILFGVLTTSMFYFMDLPLQAVSAPAIFVVLGGVIVTYCFLTRETSRKYAMNKIRAILYSLSIGLILFGLFAAFVAGFATSELFIAVSSFMVFFLVGIGLFLSFIFSGTDRKK